MWCGGSNSHDINVKNVVSDVGLLDTVEELSIRPLA